MVPVGSLKIKPKEESESDSLEDALIPADHARDGVPRHKVVLNQSVSQSVTQSVTQSLTQSVTNSLTHSVTHSLTYPPSH